jgi:hypothetical protein
MDLFGGFFNFKKWNIQKNYRIQTGKGKDWKF